MILTITAILTIGIIVCASLAILAREERIQELEEKYKYSYRSWKDADYDNCQLKIEIDRLKSTIKDDTELIGQLNKKLKAKKK